MKFWAITTLVVGGVVTILVYLTIHIQCVSSHVETQIDQPVSMVVGGGKDGGGWAVPLGNGRLVQVEVCDDYEWVE